MAGYGYCRLKRRLSVPSNKGAESGSAGGSNGVASIMAIYGLEGMRRHVDFSAVRRCNYVCDNGFYLGHIGVPQLSDPALMLERATCADHKLPLSAAPKMESPNLAAGLTFLA